MCLSLGIHMWTRQTRYQCDIYNNFLQSLYAIRKVSTLYSAKAGELKEKHLLKLRRNTWKYKYSWPCNNMGLNCLGPFIHRCLFFLFLFCFSIKIQSAFCIRRFCIHRFNPLQIKNSILGLWESLYGRAYLSYVWESASLTLALFKGRL